MPLRPVARDRTWLLPPTLDELIPPYHPARFVGAFIDDLDSRAWSEVGIAPDGEQRGAPSYDPRALLGVWLYGFMTGVRSSRKLEAACRDQLPYLWLTGWQFPDHNTLWRFYQAHRQGLRRLFRRTVRTALRLGLLELALQAVDGTKVGANAARDRSLDAVHLRQLLERTEAAIRDLEAQNETGGDPPPPRLPDELAVAKALCTQVHEALQQVQAEEGPPRVNLTDADAVLMKTRQGVVPAYNAQAVAAPLQDPSGAGSGGLLVTAGAVVTETADTNQLLPLLQQAAEQTGSLADTTLADAGYHSGPNLAACAEQGQQVVLPESQQHALQEPYHKDRFHYDPATDQYRCPQGQPLAFRGHRRDSRHPEAPLLRIYRAPAAACRTCPAFGICTTNKRGRELRIGPQDAILRQHRAWMATTAAQALYRRRRELVEPVFGILKEQQGARRFLLRGLEAVRAEWSLLLTGFNLRTLWRVWVRWSGWRAGGRWSWEHAAA